MKHISLERAAFTKPRCFNRRAAFAEMMFGCGIHYSLMVPMVSLLWVSHGLNLVFKEVLDLQLRREPVLPTAGALTHGRVKLNQHRQRLRGSGGGPVDALQTLLQSHQADEWEDRADLWLRRKLESLLSKNQSKAGSYSSMPVLKGILQEAEALQKYGKGKSKFHQ
eukprot:s46_g21.t1